MESEHDPPFGIKNSVIRGELRGWTYDDNRGVLYAIIWELGRSRADDYYVDDIVSVKPIEKP